MRNKKQLALLLTLALCGWSGAAQAAEYTETISGSGDSYGDLDIRKDEGSGNYTYNFTEGDSLKITGPNNAYGIGIRGTTANKIAISSPLDIWVEVENKSSAENVAGIYLSFWPAFKDHSVEIDRSGGGDITVISRNSTERNFTSLYGACIANNTKNSIIRLGNGDIFVKIDQAQYGARAAGLSAEGATGSKIYMGDGSVKVQANAATGEITGIGVDAYHDGYVDLGNVDIDVNVGGGDENSNMKAYGIYAEGSSQINMAGGSVSVQAPEKAFAYAVGNFENATINLNQGTTNQLVVNGDIGNAMQATTNVTFNTVDSKFNGSVNLQGGTVNMTLANGAVWNNGAGFYKTITSNVSSLAMGGGVVHQQSAQAMTIQQYSGSGDILFRADGTAAEGVLTFSQTGNVVIGEAAAGSTVHLSVSNDTVDMLDSAKAEENLNAVANKLVYDANDENLTGTVTIDEGLITPEARGDLNFYTDGALVDKGYVTNIRRGGPVTATMEAMRGVGAIPILAWRQEDSAMSQRLGDLRRSKEGQGLWTRMSRGEFEYDGQYKNQYDFFQLGWDVARGSWHYGAAVSYNDGETTYAYGSGENSSASLSLYGTWLGEAGHYADIVLKGGRLTNEYDIYTAAGHTHGDYDMWGTSLSGEYGRKIALAGGWYVTPQAQLTVMHIGSEDYTTDNGIRVHQDGLSSAVGRAGLELGRDMGDRGSVYVKASLLHDFAGSAGTYLALNGVTNEYEQDIGDTWWEAGFGVDLRLSASSWLYADVMRTFGGDIDTPWQWNAGVRWGF